jgi:Dolichyl-phosphate-mannose-protein mannosyltransferase
MPPPASGRPWTGSLAIAGWFALAGLAIHMLTNGAYGYFRDELYFLDCGQHLDWGYVDHAPLVALVAKVGRMLFGDSLHAIRFLPALAAAAKILLTGLIARELGGGRFAVGLACLCALAAPVYLALDTLLTMNAFEPVFWMASAYVLLLAINRGNPKWLVWLGVLAGLGLENKHSMLFFGFALAAGLLLTPERRWFAGGWLWAAAAIALALFLPNLIWQIRHHWPTLEALANVRRVHKNVELSPLAFLFQQVLIMLPTSLLVWGAGLWFLLFHREGKRYRALGWTFLAVLAIMMALKGKSYYLAPAYPMLFAAGGVLWERLAARAWLRALLVAAIALPGAAIAPTVLPILAPERLIRYQEALGFSPPKTEVHHAGPLPQYLGDMFGWEEMVAEVAKVYHALPPAERAQAAIYAGNYGEAGAIDLYGPAHGLPNAISGINSYWARGYGEPPPRTLIVVGLSREFLERNFESCVLAGHVANRYGVLNEETTRHPDLFVCRQPRQPWPVFWKEFRYYG